MPGSYHCPIKRPVFGHTVLRQCRQPAHHGLHHLLQLLQLPPGVLVPLIQDHPAAQAGRAVAMLLLRLAPLCTGA